MCFSRFTDQFWSVSKGRFTDDIFRAGPGFLIAPPSKPVVVHGILLVEQINVLSEADLLECEEWVSTGWGVAGGDASVCDCDVSHHGERGGGGNNNKRLMVSGDAQLDAEIIMQHNLYKGTGSIEAQSRIDQYILPCVVWQTLGEPFNGIPLRDRIPQYMWTEMRR